MAGCGRMKMRKWCVGVIALAALALGALSAAPALRADDAGPAPRTVRLSSVDGQVQLSQGGQLLADTAVANAPLFEGTRVATGDEGRAEVQFEDGSVARLSPNSSLTLTVLRGQGANAEAEITLEGGLGYFEVQGGSQTGSLKVRFGDSVVTASGFTVMRVDMDNAPGALAVFSGNAHLEHGNAVSVDLHGGESVALSATDATHYMVSETIEPDSWDAWNADRDQFMTAEAAEKTGASAELGQSSNPAWNDLDASGNWYNVPGEGQVWSPTEASNASWDPYGSGYWMNTPGYGYAWVSGYAWGYLPYQCGMWNWYETFGWGWAPGLGGCGNMLWGGGYYGGVNVGRGYTGYRPPMRPHPPRRPVGVSTLIAVNRHTVGPNVLLPPRDRNSMAQIAGHTLTPMHSLNVRPAYDRSTMVFGNGTVVTHVGSVPATGQGRPGGAIYSGSRPPANTGNTFRAPAQAPRTGSSPHVSSGASGGSRAPSFGGGGGGGASHASSGGGSHH